MTLRQLLESWCEDLHRRGDSRDVVSCNSVLASLREVLEREPGRLADFAADVDALASRAIFGSPVCPACGGALVERRGHTECSKCGRVIAGCCEGGPG
jgi:hypothetical protein